MNPLTPAPYARIAIALPLQELYTYTIPRALQPTLQLGHAVLVPFGPRKVTGYVIERVHEPGFATSRLRSIDRLLDPHPAFDHSQLDFLRWIARYYKAGLGEVIATALPAAMKAHTRTVYTASEAGIESLAVNSIDGPQAEVLRELVSRPGLTRRGLQRRLRDLVPPDQTSKSLDRLVRQELALSEQEESGGPKGQVKVVELRVDPQALAELVARPGKRQQAVVQALTGGPLELARLVQDQGPGARGAVQSLVKAGVLGVELHERRDAVTAGELPDETAPPTLNPAQEDAVERILGPPRPHLLFGVTGAGKTEVYLRAAAAVLERGQQVLVLVPEIGLTPLLTGRFRARFGDDIAVLHSGLTSAQRLREWRRIRAGEARVAVGARSALFAPFRDLGLLVVDEEHDHSYKQDEGVRYSARDLAVVRGHLAGCPVVLGSATPSLESWHNATTDRYGFIQLLSRATVWSVPQVELVDMGAQPKGDDGRVPIVSEPVRLALSRAFAAGGKAIVLYNRRGYATLVECVDCGAGYTCPSCGVSMVLHQRQRSLVCHYCGFHREQSDDCPSCHGTLEILGKGTERIEEILRELFPDVPMARMDADTTAARGAHFELLEGFRKGDTRLLVGTQIVAKGHDFPDVHVAVVLGADHVLMLPDFRSAESCFSLVTQLAGRAGRGQVAGRVLVQTRHPNHFVFQRLNDFPSFAQEELRQRQLLRYPPFSRLALLRVEGADRQQALETSWQLQRRLRATADGETVQVLGPSPAALPRLVGRWRYQLLLKGNQTGPWLRWLHSADVSSPSSGVRVQLDVDPRNLM